MPKCVWLLECHREIRFLGLGEMRVLRLCIFGCLMGGLMIVVLCTDMGIRYIGIGLLTLMWQRGGIQLIYLRWYENRTTHHFPLCVLI